MSATAICSLMTCKCTSREDGRNLDGDSSLKSSAADSLLCCFAICAIVPMTACQYCPDKDGCLDLTVLLEDIQAFQQIF